jgi:hypothetical protein
VRGASSVRQLSSTPTAMRGEAPQSRPAEDDFELLPPGCSMTDPTYGLE